MFARALRRSRVSAPTASTHTAARVTLKRAQCWHHAKRLPCWRRWPAEVRAGPLVQHDAPRNQIAGGGAPFDFAFRFWYSSTREVKRVLHPGAFQVSTSACPANRPGAIPGSAQASSKRRPSQWPSGATSGLAAWCAPERSSSGCGVSEQLRWREQSREQRPHSFVLHEHCHH
jgi:hypothetical protein